MELQLQHKPAAHCENGTISNLLRFYGVEVSEPMAFGLSSGLFFVHLSVLPNCLVSSLRCVVS